MLGMGGCWLLAFRWAIVEIIGLYALNGTQYRFLSCEKERQTRIKLPNMANASKTEARAHHFVPQCWLAGFTDTGDSKDGMLYVTDLQRRKQWRGKTSEVGHRRDFNRVEDPSVPDPLFVEKSLADVENDVAPLLKMLFQNKRGPRDGVELGTLIEFMAIQWIRLPAFRLLIDDLTESRLRKDLKSPLTWSAALRRAGVRSEYPGLDYSKIISALNSNEIKFGAKPGFYLKHGTRQLKRLDGSLKRRRWGWLVSQRGQFVASDNPIMLDGGLGRKIGFRNAELVLYPVNRHLLLYGALKPIDPPLVTTKIIAMYNTFTLLRTHEQVYSHRPDFHWLNREGKFQNDWRLFSPADFR
jgi:hypothetical protein